MASFKGSFAREDGDPSRRKASAVGSIFLVRRSSVNLPGPSGNGPNGPPPIPAREAQYCAVFARDGDLARRQREPASNRAATVRGPGFRAGIHWLWSPGPGPVHRSCRRPGRALDRTGPGVLGDLRSGDSKLVTHLFLVKIPLLWLLSR